MRLFRLSAYSNERELLECPECGLCENTAKVIEAHSWQELDGPDCDGNYAVIAQGEDHELKCECGYVYYVPGRITLY
jgi:hypothetical protein